MSEYLQNSPHVYQSTIQSQKLDDALDDKSPSL